MLITDQHSIYFGPLHQFGLVRPTSIHFGQFCSSLVYFGPLQFNYVHSTYFSIVGPFWSIQNTLVNLVMFGLFCLIRSTSVQFGQFGLFSLLRSIRSKLVHMVQLGIFGLFGPLRSIRSNQIYSVHFGLFGPFQITLVQFSIPTYE